MRIVMILALSAAAVAQVQPGDILLSNGIGPSLVVVRPGTSMVLPIATLANVRPQEAMMARNNLDYIVAAEGTPSAVLYVNALGQVSTLFSGVPLAQVRSLCVEQVDGYVVGNGGPGGAFRVRTSGQIDTLYAGNLALRSRAVETDIDTGDVLSLDANGNLLRIDAAGNATIAATGITPPDNAAMATDWRSGDVFVGTDNRVLKVNPATGIIATVFSGLPLGGTIGVEVDDVDGTLLVCSSSGLANVQGAVFRMNRSGAILSTLVRLPSTVFATGMDVVASRPLSGNGDARPGNPYFLDLDVPTAGGLPYVLAGSLGVRPGLVLGDGRTIPLNVDPVLILSLVDPFTFQNFQSVLDAVGHATATFHVPNIPALTGQRFYFAYVLLDPAAPLGIRLVSNPWGVSIR